MKTLYLVCLFHFSAYFHATSQQVLLENTIQSQQIEHLAEANNDQAIEDDAGVRSLEFYQRHPLSVNQVDRMAWMESGLFSDRQVTSLIQYRALIGPIMTIHELQAIPDWDIDFIKTILPYISLAETRMERGEFRDYYKKGGFQMLTRASLVPEKSAGYEKDATENVKFEGSPIKLALRFSYQYRDRLQYGFVADKDAGEKLFGTKSTSGFDFYSFHFLMRPKRWVKAIAIGDFAVNMGQGLIQWQSIAFGKGAALPAMIKQSPLFKPYHSFAENNFHRGLALSMGKGNWEWGAFISRRRKDANFILDSINEQSGITSIQTSGLHRTKAELADKAVLMQTSFGAQLNVFRQGWKIGMQFISHRFSLPLLRDDAPYQRFRFTGKGLTNLSVDYQYRFRNFLFFGEMASKQSHLAQLHGLLLSVDSKVDIGLIYRNISPSFQSLEARAFTENPAVNNERGFYGSIDIRPHSKWQLNFLFDYFKFPWLRYRVNGPSFGYEQALQVSYRPTKKSTLFLRYKNEKKLTNQSENVLPVLALEPVVKRNFRLNFNQMLHPDFELRCRAEGVFVGRTGAKQGFAWYAALYYHPMKKPYAANARLMFFETESYDTRIYAYENDIRYSFSVPVVYGVGCRYYLNLNYKLARSQQFWLRWSQTIYREGTGVGSGVDVIMGQSRSSLQIQWVSQF